MEVFWLFGLAFVCYLTWRVSVETFKLIHNYWREGRTDTVAEFRKWQQDRASWNAYLDRIAKDD